MQGNKMATRTLDSITPVIVESDKYFNECRSLQKVSTGLITIARNLNRPEAVWRQQTGGKMKFFTYGLDIDGTKTNLDLIACFFHWFGVSVCNFARLVGFVRGLAASDFTRADLNDPACFSDVRKSVESYVTGVSELSDVLKWRHKVGAHFAITAPQKNDNISTLDESVIFPVVFSDGRYRVNGFSFTRKNVTGIHTSSIPSWSVTEVFEQLTPRYWPGITIEPDNTT